MSKESEPNWPTTILYWSLILQTIKHRFSFINRHCNLIGSYFILSHIVSNISLFQMHCWWWCVFCSAIITDILYYWLIQIKFHSCTVTRTIYGRYHAQLWCTSAVGWILVMSRCFVFFYIPVQHKGGFVNLSSNAVTVIQIINYTLYIKWNFLIIRNVFISTIVFAPIHYAIRNFDTNPGSLSFYWILMNVEKSK